MKKKIVSENNKDSFIFDLNTSNYSNIITQNNTKNDNSQNSYNFDLVNILIITGASIVSCSILSSLSYIYYKNSFNIIQTDNIVAATASPLQIDVDPTIGHIEEERDSNLSTFSSFLGQTAGETPT